MLSQGSYRYRLRFAETPRDLREAQALRWLCFVARDRQDRAQPGAGKALDRDDHDNLCRHILIEDSRSGTLVCCFRFLHFARGAEIANSYSAQYYNLSRLEDFTGPMVEMGRFCIHPGWRDPEILRMAWAAMAEYVDSTGVEMLFGCSSFFGTEPEDHADAFAMLKERYLAPRRWLPRVKAPKVFRFARALRLRQPDPRRAMAGMPPLLRSYLAMGGWVSDHAVVDPALKTMHVFTGLEIRAIPDARKRALRALAG
ncbi:GNAT family N-acetyltransferase [Paracoccus sp. (in: a-proteobacteria)]|uniref:GNAT family N-acetyltransferase n=1 Tax=Paracoccus sp. TaxID=267 RepID=UPI003A8399A4